MNIKIFERVFLDPVQTLRSLDPFSNPLKILKNPIKYKTLIKGSVLKG